MFCLHNWKICLLDIEFWIKFFFHHFKKMFHSLLTSIVSDEKSANNWIVLPLYKICNFFVSCFPDLLFRFGLWLLTSESDSDVWLALLVFIEYLESINLYLSSNLENVWSLLIQVVFFPFFVVPPHAGTLITCMFYHLILSNRSLRLSSFPNPPKPFSIFSVCELVRNSRNTWAVHF